MSNNEKVALVTGASQGIGAGLARAYRERGYAVIAAARSIGTSEDPGVVTVEGDIADPDTAQVAVTKSLAIEYASRGLRVNAVSLGVIKTPIHDESSYAGMGALHPIGRVGEIEDVVGGVLYLESAPFVTGEILHIDGGQSAGH